MTHLWPSYLNTDEVSDKENDMLDCDTTLSFAYHIIALHKENKRLRAENAELREYKEKYNNMLDDSINYQKQMQGQVMELLLNKGEFKDKD